MGPHLAASLLRPGEIVGGHRIERLLGTGSFSEVYKAISPTGAPRALKLLTSRAPAGSKLRDRLEREAGTLARVQHPNVVQFHDAGVEGDCAYFILELVEGTTLAEQIVAHGGLPPIERVMAWLIQACDGVEAAHKAGVIHRDLKPANILITPADRVKVIDFGIAKLRYAGAPATSGGLLGTALYMAPEQLQGGHIDARADIYAMGVILYEALAGVRPIPIDGETMSAMEVLECHRRAAPRPLGEMALGVPPALAALVHRAMEQRPERRVSSMGELRDGLRAALDEPRGARSDLLRQIIARAPGEPLPDGRSPLRDSSLSVVSEPRPATTPRRRWPLAIAAVALFGALAAGALSTTGAPRHAEIPTSAPAPAAETSWRGAGERLVVEADVDADATADLVGYCGGPDGVSICAYTGTTFQQRWRAAPSVATQHHGPIGVAGRSVAYADARAIVHVLDLSTGAARGEVSLGSRAKHACTAPDAPANIWFELEDGRGVRLDPIAVQARAAPIPDVCKLPPAEGTTVPVDGGPLLRVVSIGAEIPGFLPWAARIDRGRGVEIGVDTTHSTVPMMLGFTPGQRGSTAVRWKRPVLPGDGLGGHGAGSLLELGGDRAVTVYEDLAGLPRLVSVDAVSGKTLWDVETRVPSAMMVSATRVYAQRGGRLEVREAATGALLGTVGHL